MIRQRVELGELLSDAGGEDERVEGGALLDERRHLRRIGLGAGADAIERRLWRIVVPAQSSAEALVALECHRGQDEVLQQPQVGIDSVHRRQGRGGIVAGLQQMRVDEFGPVVGVDAAQGKRQVLAQPVKALLHADLDLAQDRAGFDPRGVNVGQVERVKKLAVGAIPEWLTRSISVQPGSVTSQWSVLTGMCCFSTVPGVVRP